MVRRPFILGACFGVAIGALAVLCVLTLRGNLSFQSPVAAPAPAAANPIVLQAPVDSLPSQECVPMPEGAIPFEFNDQQYYLMPLNESA